MGGLRANVLLVDDDRDDYVLTRDLMAAIPGAGYDLEWVADYDAALEVLEQDRHEAVLIDYRLGHRTGLDLLREAVGRGIAAPLILLTGRGNHAVDVAAMEAGAVDYLDKDELSTPQLERTFRYALRHKRAEEALRRAHDELEDRVRQRTAELRRAAKRIGHQNRLLRRRMEQLAALREIDLAIAASLDLRLTLEVVLDQVLARLGVDAAGVLLYDPHSHTLESAAGKGFRTAALRQVRGRADRSLAGRTVLERRTLHVADLTRPEDSQLAAAAKAEGFSGYAAVPLVAKGQVRGVLEVFRRTPQEPDPEWLDFLEALAGQAAIAIDNAALLEGLRRSNDELALAYDATIEGWARALDLRDKETEGHTRRVTEMTLRLARALGIEPAEQAHIRRGALLHDIGKLGIPDAILLKPGPLSDEEWRVMRHHPEYAHEWLAPIAFLRPALDIPYGHHEKWDGTGYPRGLKGEQIPLAARLFAAVDVWDALRSARPYREGWPEERVNEHLRSLAGTHLDPMVVEVFLGVLARSEPHGGPAVGGDLPPAVAACGALEEQLRRASERNLGLERRQEDLLKDVARLEALTATDELTGLKSRRHFREAVVAAYSLALRRGQPLSVAMLDVDNLKAYNDEHGDPAGDEVLKAITRLLGVHVRAHDLVSRYGGEEFAVLLPATDADTARAIAERLRAAVAGHAWPLRPVTVSLGVATLHPAALNGLQLVEEADGALDRAKRGGRNRLEVAIDSAHPGRPVKRSR